MGAVFKYVEYKEMTQEEAVAAHERLENSLRHQYGHDIYGGHLGIKYGAELVSVPAGLKKYWDKEKAIDHMCDENNKWEKSSMYQIGEKHWLIGGWCPI